MNKKLMVLWAIVIVLLLTAIFLIGYSRKDREYMKLEGSIRTATYSYLKNNNLVPEYDESAIVFIEDLVNEDYLKDSESLNKYCVKSIIFTKGLFKDKYKLNLECEIDD